MPYDSATSPTVGTSGYPRPLEVGFDEEYLTSDGGLPWLAQAEAAVGICAALAARLPDQRRRRCRHSLEALLRQRVFQIACGYEDQNDADTLRHDPLLQLVCGRAPQEGLALAGQSTFSRLENAVDRRACYGLASALVEVYLRQRRLGGRPRRILLDLDSTDDPAHGAQEGVAYHGYYGQYMYHPLLIFDGDTGQLITAVLRPGTVHASRGVVAILKRLVRLLRAQWPDVPIELRADSGFAIPALYTYCAHAAIGYTLGLATNARLERLAAPLLAHAQARSTAQGGAKVRVASEAAYQAETWAHPQRVVFKVEILPKGPNVRYVVTTRTDPALVLYDWYVRRGAAENWIKDLKNGCFAHRLSCHRFWANQFRLFLHAAAYSLLATVRWWLGQRGVPPQQLDTLRLRLLKIGGRVHLAADRVLLRLAASHPGHRLWAVLATHPPAPLLHVHA
jgi:Transposase DDE domain group 1